MSAKHTPGPWAVQKYVADPVTGEECSGGTRGNLAERSRVVAADEPTMVVADVARLGSDAPANARLMAAAPELLEALKALTDPEGHIWHGGNAVCTGECKAVRAAIAKAEGR